MPRTFLGIMCPLLWGNNDRHCLYSRFFDYTTPGLYDDFARSPESRIIEVPLYVEILCIVACTFFQCQFTK